MTPEASNIQFSRQIWQAVSEHAHRSLTRKEFSPEQSRLENLRCVHFVDEEEMAFGTQIWCFEAVGGDAEGHRQIVYGLLEFSIQFALLEAVESAIFDDDQSRASYLARHASSEKPTPSSFPSTGFWIASACAAIVVMASIWTIALIDYMSRR